VPELPEMERYRTVLSSKLAGRLVTGVEINRDKSINVPASEFVSLVRGCAITGIDRRAKQLVFHLNSGNHLLVHLMLGGSMYVGNESDNPDRTKQVILSFGDMKLYFIGLRLGYLHVYDTAALADKLRDLGPEPFDPALTSAVFRERLARKKGTLKSILADQSFIGGIGNCYSDEICFEARLRPSRKADSLTENETFALFGAMKPVLQRAVQYGGYMEEPIHAGDTLTGGYNDRCLVYDRGGQPCIRCGTNVEKLEVSGRKSFLCPNCQK